MLCERRVIVFVRSPRSSVDELANITYDAPMKIIFMGTPKFAIPSLKSLLTSGYDVQAVFTQPDRPAGRGRRLAQSPIKTFALERNLTVHQPSTLKSIDVQNMLRSFNADFIVVVAYGLILPKPLLAIPQQDCINVHASLLPRWRGAAPIHHAILSGDSETGISIMQMDAGLDTGPVYAEEKCAITSKMIQSDLHDQLAEMGGKLLAESLPKILRGSLNPQPQPVTGETYANKILKSNAFIDWSQPAKVIHRQIRAFNPSPVAYTFLNDVQIRIWAAECTDQTICDQKPGIILKATPNGLDVACGRGESIRLTRLQWPGGKQQTFADLYRAKQAFFTIRQPLGGLTRP